MCVWKTGCVCTEDMYALYVWQMHALRTLYMGLEEHQESKVPFGCNGSATYFDLCSGILSRALYVSVDNRLFEVKK